MVVWLKKLLTIYQFSHLKLLSNRKNLLSHFKCTHPDVRKAAVPPPLFSEREGQSIVDARGESV
jgi:hypothetical protein